MRDALLREFESHVQPLIGELTNESSLRVAVVGGNKFEPELAVLRKIAKVELEVLTYGIAEDADVFLDLNMPNDVDEHGFDIVLSSQVIEHVHNHEQFANNLAALSTPKTLYWVNCPASNFEHGSPDYFSAGFTSSYLARLLERSGLQVLHYGNLASKRNYLARHLYSLWLSAEETRNPLRYLRRVGVRETLSTLAHWIWPLAHISLIRENKDSRWGVESWVLATLRG